MASCAIGHFIVSCDDDTFTMSSSAVLSFSADTVNVDTIFSNTPSSMRSFWVYNRNDAGLRCTSVRLERGNQSGFRVNVRGEYLGAEVGYQTNNIELYKGDSLRVFVEVTPKTQREPGPQLIEDKLTFLLENGVSQTVCLKAYSWNAKTFDKLDITRDTTIYDANPILIRGGIHVSQGATLQIQAGTTLYFNSQAGIEVDGTLRSLGTKDAPVVLRGSRLDRMFPYLPYDRVSGQWQGIKFNAESYENDIEYTDIHGAFNGIVADSADIDKTKLSIRQSTIHNCRGVGLSLNYVKAIVENCQITNTLLPCVYVKGGDVTINHSTIAQFYPLMAIANKRLPLKVLLHVYYVAIVSSQVILMTKLMV